jgi:branched-chain amino acid transport system substrate-binding protein
MANKFIKNIRSLVILAIGLSISIWHCNRQPTLIERTSIGERLLIKTNDSQDKSDGIGAFSQRDYQQASSFFKSSLTDRPNDPETRIYLSNSLAIARVGIPDRIKKIAVVVPIGSNINVSQEILRGVAQAQTEHNSRIGNPPIAIEIYNDDNQAKLAQQIANKTIADRQILAVIGSNASDASLAAAPIYQQAGLVAITPTSMTKELSSFGNYIFRTVPTSQALAATLAQQIVRVDRQQKLAICFDRGASDNVSFRDDLIAEIARAGGEIANVTCDISASNFNATELIGKVTSSGANALFISAHIDRLPQAFQLAEANRGRLPLYSSPTLHTYQTLEQGHAIAGLTLVTPWQPSQTAERNSFAERARRLWGGQVSWRTAMSYDATIAIATGIQQSDGTRQGLQQALVRSNFRAMGASGTIKFLSTGDRQLQPAIVSVRQREDKWVFATPRSLP